MEERKTEGISVGILAFNNLPLLKWTCSSLWKNTQVPLEIMIFDNGSDEGTKEWCKEQLNNPDKDFWYEGDGTNQSISKGFNTMVRNAKYDYVFLSDDDIYFMPNWDSIINEMGEVGSWRIPMMIESNRPSRAIVGDYGNSPGNFREEQLIRDYKDKVWPERRRGSFLPCILRKDDFENIGGYNEDFFVGEADFLWRAFNYYKSLGKEMLSHPTSYIYHLRNGGGLAKPRPSFWQTEVNKMKDYMEKTYGHGWWDYDKLMGHYEVTDGKRFSKVNE